MRRLFLSLSSLFLLTNCASFGGAKIENVNRSLMDLQKHVTKALPLGLRKTSPNGREFYSNYFIARDRNFRPADNLPVRSYAHILILGAERPYLIRIYVQNERAVSGGSHEYSDDGGDPAMARVIRQRLDDQLNKRREDINIIDDFRVF